MSQHDTEQKDIFNFYLKRPVKSNKTVKTLHNTGQCFDEG